MQIYCPLSSGPGWKNVAFFGFLLPLLMQENHSTSDMFLSALIAFALFTDLYRPKNVYRSKYMCRF